MTAEVPFWYETKATATVGDLGTGGRWEPFEVSPEDVERFREATGSELSARALPQGFVPVVGRLAYLAGRRMPPGGVLASLRWANHAPFPTDGRGLARAAVVRDYEKRGRRRIEVSVQLTDAGGSPVADLTYELVWPEGAP